MTVTIRDLAEKLNLSITTVSRALDGYEDVAEATRQRVVQAADEMGYRPSYAARHLRRKRADAIGYILPTRSPRFSDPFYINFLTGLCDEAASQHLDLMVTASPPGSDAEQHQYRQWVQSRRVDGLVINRTRLDDWRVEYLAQSQIPFVSLGRGETDLDYPCVSVRDAEGVKSLVQHLVEIGHRRIAFIGAPPELVIQRDRYQGYLLGLEAARIKPDARLYRQGDLTEELGYQAALELLNLPQPPTAIIGCNDLTALGALRAARDQDLNIGSELAIAGYDGIKETEYTSPPLTTLYQPTYEIARELVRMLVKRIQGEALPENCLTVEPTLVIRASTG